MVSTFTWYLNILFVNFDIPMGLEDNLPAGLLTVGEPR